MTNLVMYLRLSLEDDVNADESNSKRWGVNKTLQNMNHIMDSEQEFESAVEQI